MAVNRLNDAEAMTDLALQTARDLLAGRITPAAANARCGAARTALGGIKTERMLLSDMKPARKTKMIEAKKTTLALPPKRNGKKG